MGTVTVISSSFKSIIGKTKYYLCLLDAEDFLKTIISVDTMKVCG